MRLKLKSRKIRGKILLLTFLLSGLTSLSIFLFDLSWNTLDYRATDRLYKFILNEGKGPQVSGRIIYLIIDDKSYNYFNTNYLSRAALAELNNILINLNTNAVFYDMIFPRSSIDSHDTLFSESIYNLGNVYLPAGFKLSDTKISFRQENGIFFDQLKEKYLTKLKTSGRGSPFYSEWVLPQKDIFAENAFNSGHISTVSDADGILRHHPLIIKVDSLFFPAISLAIFLDYNRIPFGKIEVNWGKSIQIPAVKGSFLDENIVIPIDDEGKMFIPYYEYWDESKTKMIKAQNLLEYYNQPEYLDDLLDLFEGNFVFISDISVGTSDLGQTTLEEDVPLVSIHAALLNSLLTNIFYSKWNNLYSSLLIFPLGLILGLASLTKSNLALYITGILLITGLIFYSYYEILNFSLFPITTLAGAVLIIFIGMLIGLYFLVSKEQTFIKNAFSKYVPSGVVNELVEKPELLKLGGEERVLSILFSDIAGFTTIAESIKSTKLVTLLNEYLTEMTNIVLQQGGTIDKYIGDAILAEFGAPIQMEDHSSAAVTTALLMQKRIKELSPLWEKKDYPEIKCRIGINTGNIILGNMGSEQVFDYTVIGDAVNLAARLEGANKFYHTDILISEFTLTNLSEKKFRTRLIDVIKVKGKSKAVKVHEVYGFASDMIADEEYYIFYEKGYDFYLQKEFDKAKDFFRQAIKIKQSDHCANEMLKRIDQVEIQALDELWDGSFALTEK